MRIAGCGGDDGGAPGEGGAELPPCEESLDLAPSHVTVAPMGLVLFRASGGTGDYRFEVSENLSGASINAETGAYVSGPTPELDVVAVSDLGCRGAASVEVEVAEGLSLRPAWAEVPPGTEVRFEVSGGTGAYELALAESRSGATLSPDGVYRAGPDAGRDRVRLTDGETGATSDAVVVVDPAAELSPEVGRVYLPLGSDYRVLVQGGSGSVIARPASGVATFADGVLTGVAPGREVVPLEDAYATLSTTLDLVVVPPLDAGEATWVEDPRHFPWNRAVGPGDLDGDGVPDAVVALPGANAGRFEAGAVLVYRGGREVLGSEPAQVLRGSSRFERFGHGIAVADFDGDGLLDLAAGADGADATGVNSGAVWIFRGVEEGFFEEEPWHAIVDGNAHDGLGAAVAACDFDGDGWPDLAAGAPRAEDLDRMPRVYNHGSVHVYLSRGTLPTVPDAVIHGGVPDGSGGFEPVENLWFGRTLAAGDFDGDGRCDLAVQSHHGSNGIVYLYRGREDLSGIHREPSLVIAGWDDDELFSHFGQSLALADLDGDGRAELVAGQHRRAASGRVGAGAVRVFRGRELAGPARDEPTLPSAADWTVEGGQRNAEAGHFVQVVDADGDGSPDLVVGHPRATAPGSDVSRPGVITVHRGREGALPEIEPWRVFEGARSDERFGMVGAVVGDADGSGSPDLVVLAPHADPAGRDTGEIYAVSDTGALRSLSFPGEASGRRVGSSVADVSDVTGDGLPDLLVGASHAAEARGADAGVALLYRGTADGFESEPALVLAGFPTHERFDWLGIAVAGIGDFDGDGDRDFAVAARYGDLRDDVLDTERFALDGSCEPDRTNTGAVHVFRGGAALDDQPDFIYYGPFVGGTIAALAGSDVTGDGRPDLIVGGKSWRDRGSNTGGVAVVEGRHADDLGRITVICSADYTVHGAGGGVQMGTAVVALDDIDGDGCGDIAASAPYQDHDTRTDAGIIHVLSGAGALGCPAEPEVLLRLFGPGRVARAGRSLVAAELDGEAGLELLVGSAEFRDDRGEIGRVDVVTGAYLREHLGSADPVPFAERGAAARLTIEGGSPGERLGTAVTVVPGAGPAGEAVVAAGGPRANIGGLPMSGGVRLHAFGAGGFAERPFAVMTGETVLPGSLLGHALARAGDRSIAVGVPWSSAHGLELGATYVLDLDP